MGLIANWRFSYTAVNLKGMIAMMQFNIDQVSRPYFEERVNDALETLAENAGLTNRHEMQVLGLGNSASKAIAALQDEARVEWGDFDESYYSDDQAGALEYLQENYDADYIKQVVEASVDFDEKADLARTELVELWMDTEQYNGVDRTRLEQLSHTVPNNRVFFGAESEGNALTVAEETIPEEDLAR